MYRISDIVPLVRDKLRGRSDLSDYSGAIGSDIPSWIYQAIMDLTPNFPFEELVIANAPITSFIMGQSSYPISYFLAENGPPYTMVRSFFRYFINSNNANGGIFQPYNATASSGVTGSVLKNRVTSVVYPMSVIPGLPTYWCQNGNSLLFGFQPDNTYQVQMMYQREHPFSLSNLPACTIYMPNDWKEVLAYAAAIKGCDFLGLNDIGMTYYKMLHGDPKKPGNIGLLMEKKSQLERNLVTNERQLQPIVSTYC